MASANHEGALRRESLGTAPPKVSRARQSSGQLLNVSILLEQIWVGLEILHF